MASKLKAVEPKQAKQQKPKIMIFGQAGVGKTWTSLDFPKAYYIDTEGGATNPQYVDKLIKAKGVYFGVEQGSLSFGNIIEQVKALASEKHEYKTLIIDSISKVFNISVQEEAERIGNKNAFGADKKIAISHMRRLVSWLSRIDMNVILIAHEKALWFKQEQIGTTFDCWDKLDYELDLVLNIIKNGKSRFAKVKKSRLEEFPDGENIIWSFEEFSKRYGLDAINRDGDNIVLASKESLQKLKYLINLYKVDEEIQERWLKKANCEMFEDMDSDKVLAIIDMLEKKANQTIGKE